MRLTKKNLRAFGRVYSDFACPSLVSLTFATDRSLMANWVEIVLLIKELVVFLVLWSVLANITTDWLLWLPAMAWAVVPTILCVVILPVIQSPLKVCEYIWENYIPEGDEEDKQKNDIPMRLSDDGELVEVEDDDRFERIKVLANQKRN